MPVKPGQVATLLSPNLKKGWDKCFLTYMFIYYAVYVLMCYSSLMQLIKMTKSLFFREFPQSMWIHSLLMEDSSYVCKYTQADSIFSIVENINFPETCVGEALP